MARIERACPGDCSKCELLASGEVEMVPCILDQIFQRTQKNEMRLNQIMEDLKPKGKIKLADIDSSQKKEVTDIKQTDKS